MKKYEEADIEVIIFDGEDVIRTSDPDSDITLPEIEIPPAGN